MEDFSALFHNLKPSLSEMNSNNMELMMLNNMIGFENLNSSNVQGLLALSNDTFLDHQQQQPQLPSLSFTDNIQSSLHSNGSFYDPLTHFLPLAEDPRSEEKIMKGISETDPILGTGLVADNKNKRNCSLSGKKRKRSKDQREVEKPGEVIHVRAKRGQATDSHSLAERLRREKINEKLRSLQDLVPGCYKTMGMAVMLDVIINYVQSLQNQIEFLSMKLSAASLFYDFNSDVDNPMDSMQGTNGYETQGMEQVVGEGYGGEISHFPSTYMA